MVGSSDQSSRMPVANAISDFTKTLITLLVLVTCVLASTTQAETRLNASVDRNKIYETDTLNLRISGETDVEISLGGLFNFGRSDMSAPNIPDLEDDFEILDRQQQYNMQSINGETKAQVTWNYMLAPKRTGTLTIPPVEYKGATTEAITVDVSAGQAPRNADEPPLVFIEVEVDKPSAYVQEQVIYTIRLFASEHLASGDLSQPEPNDAIVEALGDTRKFFRMAYNQRYEVRERQYLIFPQKSGTLNIRPQTFSGMLINTRTRQRMRVRELSDPIDVEVKAPPASFSGDIWLPATSLHLTETWEQEPNEMFVGDSLTRTLEVKALGLLGSALPPFPVANVAGIKVYPDQPVVESFQHESGAQAQRQEAHAMVAVGETRVTLPEIRIPWWDTANDVERVAVIPERSFEVKPNPALANTAKPLAIPQSGASSVSDQNALDTAPTANAGEDIITTIPAPVNNQGWYLIVALLLAGWISTTWFLLQRNKRHTMVPGKDTTKSPSLLEAALKAVKQDDVDMPKHVVMWADECMRRSGQVTRVVSIQDLKQVDDTLFAQVSQFEAARYAPAGTQRHGDYDKKQMLNIIKTLDSKFRESVQQKGLKPFYPGQ